MFVNDAKQWKDIVQRRQITSIFFQPEFRDAFYPDGSLLVDESGLLPVIKKGTYIESLRHTGIIGTLNLAQYAQTWKVWCNAFLEVNATGVKSTQDLYVMDTNKALHLSASKNSVPFDSDKLQLFTPHEKSDAFYQLHQLQATLRNVPVVNKDTFDRIIKHCSPWLRIASYDNHVMTLLLFDTDQAYMLYGGIDEIGLQHEMRTAMLKSLYQRLDVRYLVLGTADQDGLRQYKQHMANVVKKIEVYTGP